MSRPTLAGDAGNVKTEFTITLSGLLPLTAANFTLTPSQSSADLAYGAALTSAKVKTRRRSSETSIERPRPGLYVVRIVLRLRLRQSAADNLNLSATTNQLLLYDPA